MIPKYFEYAVLPETPKVFDLKAPIMDEKIEVKRYEVRELLDWLRSRLGVCINEIEERKEIPAVVLITPFVASFLSFLPPVDRYPFEWDGRKGTAEGYPMYVSKGIDHTLLEVF